MTVTAKIKPMFAILVTKDMQGKRHRIGYMMKDAAYMMRQVRGAIERGLFLAVLYQDHII